LPHGPKKGLILRTNLRRIGCGTLKSLLTESFQLERRFISLEPRLSFLRAE